MPRELYFDSIPITAPAAELRRPEVLLIKRDTITIEFTYPLHQPRTRTFQRAGGFTRRALFECIQQGYRTIYKNWRRNQIWGHAIADLFLEGATIENDQVQLRMGS